MERTTYHHGDLRQALLKEATDMLAEAGAKGLSMRGLARRLGVSHAAPGHHFTNKDALLAAIAAEGFAQLADTMEAASAAAEDDPLKRFGATGLAYITFACAHPSQFRLMFRPELFEGDYPEKRNQERRAFRILMSNAQASVSAENQRDVEAVALSAWSTVHGVATLWLDGPLRMPGEKRGRAFASVDEVAQRVMDLFQLLLKQYNAS